MKFTKWAQKIGAKLGKIFKKPRKKRLKKLPKKRKKRSKKLLAIAEIPRQKALYAIEEFSIVQLSPHTQRAYKRDLRDFFSYLKTKDLFEEWQEYVNPSEIALYRNFLIEVKGLAKSSVTRKLAVLKSFYKWSHAQGWVDRNPAELVRSFPQTQDSKTGYLNEEEIHKLLSRKKSIHEMRLSEALAAVTIECLLMLGLRRSEASAMRVGHLEYIDQKWLLTVQGKGNRERKLPLAPRLARTLCQWFQRISEEAPLTLTLNENTKEWVRWAEKHVDQPILISTRAKTFEAPLSTSEIARIVRKKGFQAGLINRISPHVLRSTAITYALDQGASHRGVQQMAGWTTPLMISRYDKRRNDPKFSAVHKLKYAHEKKVKE